VGAGHWRSGPSAGRYRWRRRGKARLDRHRIGDSGHWTGRCLRDRRPLGPRRRYGGGGCRAERAGFAAGGHGAAGGLCRGWARATGGAGRVQDGTGGGAAGRPVLIGIGSATQDTGPVDASEIGGPWGPAAVTAAVGAGLRGPASPRAGTAPRAGSAEGGRGP